MFATFLVACVLYGACGSASDPPKLDGRIVGGDVVDIADFPYQISLQLRGSHICGGSILSHSIILTAAHCTIGQSPFSLSIRAGSSTRESGGQAINVADIIHHPQYNSRTIDYDISILKLFQPLVMGAKVRVISIALPPQPGSLCVVSGWGTTTEGGKLPTFLQAVLVPIISLAACRNDYSQSAITGRMICAGYAAGGKDSCQGDSGGPLACDGKLVGIVSWGHGCARPNLPGVFTNLEHFINWIKAV